MRRLFLRRWLILYLSARAEWPCTCRLCVEKQIVWQYCNNSVSWVIRLVYLTCFRCKRSWRQSVWNAHRPMYIFCHHLQIRFVFLWMWCPHVNIYLQPTHPDAAVSKHTVIWSNWEFSIILRRAVYTHATTRICNTFMMYNVVSEYVCVCNHES